MGVSKVEILTSPLNSQCLVVPVLQLFKFLMLDSGSNKPFAIYIILDQSYPSYKLYITISEQITWKNISMAVLMDIVHINMANIIANC